MSSKNPIDLCNYIFELGLHLWNPKASGRDYDRLRLQRIFGCKSMIARSELLADAVAA
jgi:hypothetical protein